MARSGSLKYYIAVRCLLAPLMIWTATTIVFLLLRVIGGDPVEARLGPRVPPEIKQQMREQMGLTGPLWQQYLDYIGNLFRFNLGNSMETQGLSVNEIIVSYFPATIELAVISLAIAFFIGLGVGSLSASRPNSGWDLFGRLFGIITYAIPPFWAGMLMQLVFAVQFKWFPAGTRWPIGVDQPTAITGLYTLDSLLTGNLPQFGTAIYYLFLPCFTLGLLLSGIFERIVRVNLRQSLQAEFVEAARARGIGERRIIFVHALKNALIPVITILGLTLAALLGGALLTEVTFSWPGLASRLFQAISSRDYTTVQGIIVFFAAIVVVASILIDIISAYIDPRIRY
ncbi:MAG: ABC transporter permease [Synechococcales cyanobacterium RU_4_20]|nr:ABC transporter permease [Synechococcales cyanobacterium RU_4_20]NJR71026.1 ABC transporter permease [Synechococcales cyanobacterium CRU_2_2]